MFGKTFYKSLVAGLAVSSFAVVAVAYAGQFSDVKKKVIEARNTLVTMLNNKERRGVEQQKAVTASSEAVSAMLAKVKAPAGKEAQLKELQETWAAFRKTREEKLVPLILAGKDDEAKRLAGGVQKERMVRMIGLCDELEEK